MQQNNIVYEIAIKNKRSKKQKQDTNRFTVTSVRISLFHFTKTACHIYYYNTHVFLAKWMLSKFFRSVFLLEKSQSVAWWYSQGSDFEMISM